MFRPSIWTTVSGVITKLFVFAPSWNEMLVSVKFVITPVRRFAPGRRFTADVFGTVVGDRPGRAPPVAVVPCGAVVGCGTLAPFKPRVDPAGGAGIVLPGIFDVPLGVRPGPPPIGV
jgi:hypothetical protein